MGIINIKSRVAGLLLIVIGILLFTGNYIPRVDSSETLISVYWPSFTVLLIGIILHFFYLLSDWKGSVFFLIPGGILITLGMLFQIAVYFDAWKYVWPGFIIAPAVGFTEYFLLGGRQKWALIPIGVLTSVSLILFLVFTVGNFVNFHAVQWLLAVLFILVGLFIMLGGKPKRSVGR
jgi:uncharacterized membrane protein